MSVDFIYKLFLNCCLFTKVRVYSISTAIYTMLMHHELTPRFRAVQGDLGIWIRCFFLGGIGQHAGIDCVEKARFTCKGKCIQSHLSFYLDLRCLNKASVNPWSILNHFFRRLQNGAYRSKASLLHILSIYSVKWKIFWNPDTLKEITPEMSPQTIYCEW